MGRFARTALAAWIVARAVERGIARGIVAATCPDR